MRTEMRYNWYNLIFDLNLKTPRNLWNHNWNTPCPNRSTRSTNCQQSRLKPLDLHLQRQTDRIRTWDSLFPRCFRCMKIPGNFLTQKTGKVWEGLTLWGKPWRFKLMIRRHEAKSRELLASERGGVQRWLKWWDEMCGEMMFFFCCFLWGEVRGGGIWKR